MRLEDKVIIVTGAAGGLGRQYAIRFAKEGAKLTVADIQDTTQTAELCRAEGADVLSPVHARIREAWGSRLRAVRWPLSVRAGRA